MPERTCLPRGPLVTILCRATLAMGLVLAASTPPAGAETLTGESVRLDYHADPLRGLVLTALGDTDSATAFSLSERDIWEIELVDPTAPAPLASGVITITPSTSTSTFSLTPRAGGFGATWADVRSPLLPSGDTLDVHVDATVPPGDAVVELRIHVVATTPSLALYGVRFPLVHVKQRGAPADQRLAWPYAGGWLLHDPVHGNPLVIDPATYGLAKDVIHPGYKVSMQFMSYYDASETDGPNLYFGTRDTTGHVKEFLVSPTIAPQVEGLLLGTRQIPENNLRPAGEYTAPWPFVLGVIRGDWYDAAHLYRTWALEQSWTAGGPMRTNPDFSPLVRDAPMFAFTEAPSSGDFAWWERDVADQETYFGVTGIATHVQRWHNNQFDDDWGDWFPADPSYVAAGPTLAAAGNPHAPYVILNYYSSDAHDYANSEVPGFAGHAVSEFAALGEDGTRLTIAEPQGSEFASLLCHATDFMSAYATTLAERLHAEVGAQGLYLDIFSGEPAPLCYDLAHGHPTGGGDAYNLARLDLVRSLKTTLRASAPGFFLYSENLNEMFLGLTELLYAHHSFDAYYDGATPRKQIIPLFTTVYNDHLAIGMVAPIQIPFVNYLTPNRLDPILRIRRREYQAQLHLGHEPRAGSGLSTVSLAQNLATLPQVAAAYESIRDSVTLLEVPTVRGHVRFGERLRDPTTDAVQVLPVFSPMPDVFLPLSLTQPVVYTSAWRAPRHGGAGLLLINWTLTGEPLCTATPLCEIFTPELLGGDQNVEWTLDPARYDLTAGRYRLTEIAPTGTVASELIDIGTTPLTRTQAVPAGSARFVQLAPAYCAEAAPGSCSPGGTGNRECALELRTHPVAPLSRGLPGTKLSCRDGDSTCDGDGTENGTCTIGLAICLNNADPRLPACTPAPVATLELLAPSVATTTTSPVLAPLRAILSDAVDVLMTAPGAADNCTEMLPLPVPAGRRVAVALRVKLTTRQPDADTIRLGCTQAAG